jgi:predicted DNA-binding helix-hairpin-helix protein
MLDLAIDPKLAWALEHREDFPMDVNRASREQLLRVPGFGVRSVDRILQARRHGRLRMADLGRLRLPIAKIAPFVVTADHRPRVLDRADLAGRLAPRPRQADLFA